MITEFSPLPLVNLSTLSDITPILLPPFSLNLSSILHNSSLTISDTCLAFVLAQITNPNPLYLLSLLVYSGKGFNQLGDYLNCLALDNSTYYLANIALGGAYTNLFMGFCMNKACSIEDILEVSMIDGNGFYRMIEPSAIPIEVDWGTVLTIVLLGISLLLAVTSTIYFKVNKGKQVADQRFRWFYYFSLQSTSTVFSRPGEIKVLNGVRALCFIFVVIGHIISTTANTGTNITSMKLLVQQYFFTVIISLPYVVDVFFMLGGFMVGFLFLKIYSRNPKRMMFLTVIAQRALRFWPLFILALLFYWKLFPTFGYGPLFVSYKGSVAMCEDYWWSDLLFIGNFRDGMCVVWAWYVENDMQFFILSIIFVFIYFHVNKKLSKLLQVSTILMSVIYTFVIYQMNQYHVNGKYEDLLSPKASQIYVKVYIKPWTRVSPYMLGLLVGIAYFEHKELKQPTFLENALKKRWVRYSLPPVGLLVLIGIVSVTYSLSHDMNWPQFFHSLYASVIHFVYPLCYMLIILPILYGYTNPFKYFFENQFFQFVGKITFACYMVHYPYLVWRSLVGYNTPYVSPAFGLIYASMEMIPILALGLVVALCFEFPIASMLDDLTGKRKGKAAK